ncbi:hypothetical protein Pr1d_23650 [Bythopirellula goksoeyrii]|uniref:Secreted protein n=1 Tax=Bythopirellula goksoeyrii TaxID=1400387 RepID=A0A5B9Q7Q7_9BACT|nr:hypothetical protein Pr1d_23650 [Bythopirellula goksoeyrii]
MDGRLPARGARSQYLRLRLFLAGVLLTIVAGIFSPTEASESAPQAGLLVLTNGSVLEGVVSLEGEHYRVMLPKGELQVRVTQVDFFCKNLDEAYERRQERSRGNSVDSHVELAQWCVQQGMLEHAMEEISLARSLDSQHRMLEVLTRQVDQLRSNNTKIVDTELEPATNPTESESTQVTTVSTAHEIPQWARVEFVRRIQPMLIHTCATGGCHYPGSSSKMQLDREALAGIGNPDLIQQNLDSVVRQLSFDDSESSPLLARGLAVHGKEGQKQSEAFTPRQVAILRAWFTQLVSEQIDMEESLYTGTKQNESATNSGSIAQQQHEGAKSRHSGARDPFDPTQFNDRQALPADKPTAATPLPQELEHQLDRPTVAIP